tara:strand:+ start:245 stop:475 length:231 start_codon:yes stop_codon:yes gene_type:complete
MNFKKEELQEMLERQLDGVSTWLETVNSQALTIRSQQNTISELTTAKEILEDKNTQLRRKLAFKEYNERQREKEMN